MKALADHGGSNREIAEGAAVSFRSLAEARNGFPPEQLKSSRKQLGVAESMTRLSTFLRVEPEAVLQELGIDPADPTVRRHLKRVRAESVPPDRVEDSVLHRIRTRALTEGKSPSPIVGLVHWEPFFDGQITGRTMGGHIAQALLGSLNPKWSGSENLKCCENFVVAEEQLLSDEPATPDVVLGLYDLPWRRGEGVDVIALPGLSVRLGGLSTRKELGWGDVLLAAERDTPSPPFALVIEGDAGSKLISGPVVYPKNRLLKPLQTFDPVKIAERIKRDVDQYRDKPQGFVFVADGPLVSQVMAELPDVGVAADTLHQLQDVQSAPSYRFGLGVPADARRFRLLLEDAISQDLFGRVLPKTVALYLRLLGDDQHGRLTLDISELCRFGARRDVRFVELAFQQAVQADEVEPVGVSLKEAGVPVEVLSNAGFTGASLSDPGKGRR